MLLRQRGIGAVAVLVAVAVVSLVVFGAWKVWDANRDNKAQQSQKQPVTRTFTSAKGLFEITFPEGWWGIRRVMDSDRFVISGKEQPVSREDERVVVEDVVTFDDGIATVFDVNAGQNFPSPEGIATDFLAGSGAQLLSGRKYVHVYDADTTDAKGRQRDRNDRDYTYVFALGGERELRVTYSVYRDNPHDQAAIIDRVVDSIRKLE